MVLLVVTADLLCACCSENEAALVACAGCVLSMMLVRTLLPSTTKKNKDRCRNKCRKQQHIQGNPAGPSFTFILQRLEYGRRSGKKSHYWKMIISVFINIIIEK